MSPGERARVAPDEPPLMRRLPDRDSRVESTGVGGLMPTVQSPFSLPEPRAARGLIAYTRAQMSGVRDPSAPPNRRNATARSVRRIFYPCSNGRFRLAAERVA